MTQPGDVKGFQILQNVLARAVEDDAHRERLIGDPHGVLEEADMSVDRTVEIVVHENTPERLHLVLPSRTWEDVDADETHAPLIIECPF
jgi:hypothetical protein